MNRREFLAASALPLVSARFQDCCRLRRRKRRRSTGPLCGKWLVNSRARPTRRPSEKLPDNLNNIDYDRYRAIRFLPERALWRGEKLPFQAQFFHRGFFYKNRVDIFEVKNGQASKIVYQPDLFSFGDLAPPGACGRSRLCRFSASRADQQADYYDEVCVFLGASYFRAVAKGQLYGLSARGLAINTGEAKGEEFPFFKAFWIEKPADRRQLYRRARAARQRKRGGGLSLHYPSG